MKHSWRETKELEGRPLEITQNKAKKKTENMKKRLRVREDRKKLNMQDRQYWKRERLQIYHN